MKINQKGCILYTHISTYVKAYVFAELTRTEFYVGRALDAPKTHLSVAMRLRVRVVIFGICAGMHLALGLAWLKHQPARLPQKLFCICMRVRMSTHVFRVIGCKCKGRSAVGFQTQVSSGSKSFRTEQQAYTRKAKQQINSFKYHDHIKCILEQLRRTATLIYYTSIITCDT